MNYKEKIEHALDLIEREWRIHGAGLVVAHSLGKDSAVVWDLAKRVNRTIRGFIVTTQFKPLETKLFMSVVVAQYPELRIFKNDTIVADDFPKTNPDECCRILKVEQTRRAIDEMGATCWVTGLRKSEGHTRLDFEETEHRDKGLLKLNPILGFEERDVWAYIALNDISVNPLYGEGYRSLGCEPCTSIAETSGERDGRWADSDRIGGECGIHSRGLRG